MGLVNIFKGLVLSQDLTFVQLNKECIGIKNGRKTKALVRNTSFS